MNPRQRMIALAAVAGLGSTGLLGLAAGTAQATAQPPPRIRVIGIAHNGKRVPVFATVFTKDDHQVETSPGRSSAVQRGPTWIGADVQAFGKHHVILSDTLVLRRLIIRHNQRVILDARPGVPVSFSLNVPGAAEPSESVAACITGRSPGPRQIVASNYARPLYVVPLRSQRVRFGYGSHWQGPSAGYTMAGQSRGGIPARPDYSASLSGMAKLSLTYRAGEATGYNSPQLVSNGTCGVSLGLGLSEATGQTQTEYVTPGSWTTDLLGYEAGWSSSRRYKAGHRYDSVFGGAVWGPGTEAPRAGGSRITYYPDVPFVDPAQPTGAECCDKSSITLFLGRHELMHQIRYAYHARPFSAHVTAAGWYTLAIRAWRWKPHQAIRKDQLSPTDSYRWRFYALPRSTPADHQREVPAYVARIWAGGLNIDNQAAAGGSTTLNIHILRTHDKGIPRARRHRLTSVRAQVSFDGGKTWQALGLKHLGGAWQATVNDPETGFVALRTTVTDSRGDTSEQTIYRAYAIG
jgi:hypothetical protein